MAGEARQPPPAAGTVMADSRRRSEPVLRPWLARPIEHVGSTSIPGMAAKAIIDTVAVIHTREGLHEAVGPLEALGWVHAPEPEDAGPLSAV